MSQTTQTVTPSFTPPPAAALSLISNTTLSKTKAAAYLLNPASGAPAPSTVNILRALTGKTPLTALVADLVQPLSVLAPTTATNLTYRQCPNFGLARNLVTNGGTVNAHGWTLNAVATIVTDATSPTGFAVRHIATGAGQYTTQTIPVEAGKTYVFAMQARGDGSAGQSLAWQFLDAAGNAIGAQGVLGVNNQTVWTEIASAAAVAPGNARSVQVQLYNTAGTGIAFFTAIRVMQQATAPAAWTAAHQQFIQRGVSIYEASTNLAADGNMEAVGVASYTATTATLTKTTTNPFAGTQRLTVTNTAAFGFAQQTGALAAGQAVTVSVRCIGADASSGIVLRSTPSNTQLGSDVGASTDWVARRVSGTIPGGDTGWSVQLAGGAGSAAVSHFDNLAVENKAYDTMNADPSGQAFALAGRTASDVRLPLPSGFNLADFAVVLVYRPDLATALNSRYLMDLAVDGNNRYAAYVAGSSGEIDLVRTRAGISTVAARVIGFAAGDTIAIGIRKNSTGISIWSSLNGAAAVQATSTTAEAQLDITGTPTLWLGEVNGGGNNADGTISVYRFLKSGLTDAQISAKVTAPYADPDDNDAAMWLFEGQGYQVPVVDDRLIKLGTSYDYRADVSSGGTTAATATGQIFTGSTAALTTSWWLRSQQDPTKDITFYTLKQHKYKVLRPAQPIKPASGGLPSVIYTGNIEGISGQIEILAAYTTTAQQALMEAAFRTLLGSNDTVWLQSAFGGLFKVRFTQGVELALHEVFLDAVLDVLEVL